jgi:hypothetical protein
LRDDGERRTVRTFRRFAFGALIVIALGPGCASRKDGAEPVTCRFPALRQELLAMEAEDQQVREGFGPNLGEAKAKEMLAVDTRHTVRMRAIVATYGWPGRSLVGMDGAAAAWPLVQHAELEFMAECLPLLQRAASNGEALPRHYAYLLDRVRVRQGKPQVYGTQFSFKPDGRLLADPIEDAAHVDERRHAVGLPPMADYERELRKTFR